MTGGFGDPGRPLWDADAVDDGLSDAVLDNARWCDLVCRTQGIQGRFVPDAWVSPRRTPDGYPDAVTLSDHAVGDQVLGRVDTSSGCSVKDSFASLDLTGRGFRILFDGAWIRRPAGRGPGTARPMGGLGWVQVTAPKALAAWAADHGGGPTFRPALLGERSVVILAAHDATGQRVAGAVATVADHAVGISNVFASGGSAAEAPEEDRFAEAFAGATGAIAERFPDRAIVGYLSASLLAAAHAAEYDLIGPMRVWMLDESSASGTR